MNKIKQALVEIFNDKELLNYEPKHPCLWRFIKHFIIAQALVVAMTYAYIEIGHDRGWIRADVWYTCLHTHNHFPWQKNYSHDKR